MRKEAKKVKALGIGFKNTHKGLRIPNLYPHKKALLQDLERKKRTNTREEQIELIKGKNSKNNHSEQQDIEALVKEAEEKEIIFEQNYKPQNDMEADYNNEKKDLSRKAFIKELEEVVENSDVTMINIRLFSKFLTLETLKHVAPRSSNRESSRIKIKRKSSLF